MMASQEQTSLSQDKVSISLTQDEESFTPFSDSEASLSSSKSPDHSPRNSNLTLEQFCSLALSIAEEETGERNILIKKVQFISLPVSVSASVP